MRIGELAAQTGVPVKTIRYYESIGVLDEAGRTPSGYRDYDEAAVGQLEFVRAAQAVGLTLGEIRQVVAVRARGEAPCAHVTELVEARVADFGRRIKEMQRMRTVLAGLAERARSLDTRDCDPAQVCHIIRPRS